MQMSSCTGQIEKVRVLVELVEDGTRAVLDVGRGEYGNRMRGQRLGELDAAAVVLLSGNARCDCASSVCRECVVVIRSYFRRLPVDADASHGAAARNAIPPPRRSMLS